MVLEEVKKAISDIWLATVGRSLSELNLFREAEIENGKVKVKLASTALDTATREWVKEKVKEKIGAISDLKNIEVEFVEISPKDLNKIDHVIAIMSGKGGVGKSLVTALLAMGLRRKGFSVGILDADLTGPSIPKMFGVISRPSGSESGILPVRTAEGILIMSMNLLLPREDDALIWRGPLITKAIQQFWNDVLWGNLNFLLVDLPPGTSDAPLTVMQTIPLSGVILVYTPQDLATLIVKKAVKMAQTMKIPILGVIENMSYFVIPETGKKIELFGASKSDEMTRIAQAPLLAQIPVDPELARLCDEGNIGSYSPQKTEELTESLLKSLKERSKEGK